MGASGDASVPDGTHSSRPAPSREAGAIAANSREAPTTACITTVIRSTTAGVKGGAPSVQVSIAPDCRRADTTWIGDPDLTFPIDLFNGHLTSSNSDVRAGDNYDRHKNRWAGFQNWW